MGEKTIWYVDFSPMAGIDEPQLVNYGSIIMRSIDEKGRETPAGVTAITGTTDDKEVYHRIAEMFIEAAKEDESLVLRLGKDTPKWLRLLFFKYLRQLARTSD